ncbi:unnamed protein product [Rotaria sp. Silwood2]|nr:unnamed protein product [Rotaria sp. Silwood2]CAF4454694.1 unnamed protein product [Rotaria sp. Silwood2]
MSKKLNKDKLSSSDHNRASLSISPIPLNQEILPLTGIEQETFIQQALSDIKRRNDLMKTISSIYNFEPIYIELRKEDNVEEEIVVDLFESDHKKDLGNKSKYDSVVLFDENILVPGKPDVTLSYKSKTYRFANEDNQSLYYYKHHLNICQLTNH